MQNNDQCHSTTVVKPDSQQANRSQNFKVGGGMVRDG